ncbi:MAG: Magnesium and cobalt efflux protein CorC [Firmicutes bacterium]|nr:Magnesium and cobalt efflux protein CorC [candidate division NPL-UPA2 bacterium]
MDSHLWHIVVLVALLMMSAYFSAMETALMSLGRLRVRHLVDEGAIGAKRVERLLSNPGRLLSTILIGNNMVNIAATSVATFIAINLFGEGTGLGVATVVMTLVILIFGEISPKTFGLHHNQRISLRHSGLLSLLLILFNPLAVVLEGISRLLLTLIGGHFRAPATTFSEEELRTLVTVGQEEGILQVEEKEMITSVIEFGDTLVKDIMTPRTEVVRVSVRITYPALLDILRRNGYSRVPVYDNGIDDIVGVLHAKDLLGLAPVEPFDVRHLLRSPYFVPELKRVSELLADFKRKKLHMAIVVDEYGGTAGLITLEDLVEEIMGDIADEYDEDELPDFTYIDDNTIEMSGSLNIRDASEVIGRDLPAGEYDTVGGMIMYRLGTVPSPGDCVMVNDLQFTVKSMDGSRVEAVTIVLNSEQS